MKGARGQAPRGAPVPVAEPAFEDRIASTLEGPGCEALVVVASSSRDPDVAAFAGTWGGTTIRTGWRSSFGLDQETADELAACVRVPAPGERRLHGLLDLQPPP